jgi:hypothetical protein
VVGNITSRNRGAVSHNHGCISGFRRAIGKIQLVFLFEDAARAMRTIWLVLPGRAVSVPSRV